MLTIAKPTDNRLDVTLSGALDTSTMRDGLRELLDKAEDIDNGRMLYRIPDFAMPSFGALMVELGLLPKLLGLVRRFDRCAVLSDSAWLREAAEVEGAVLPGLAIKGFTLDDEAGAEAWLSAA